MSDLRRRGQPTADSGAQAKGDEPAKANGDGAETGGSNGGKDNAKPKRDFSIPLAKALEFMGKEQFDKALCLLEEAMLGLEKEEKDAACMHNLGVCYSEAGDFVRAEEVFWDAFELIEKASTKTLTKTMPVDFAGYAAQRANFNKYLVQLIEGSVKDPCSHDPDSIKIFDKDGKDIDAKVKKAPGEDRWPLKLQYDVRWMESGDDIFSTMYGLASCLTAQDDTCKLVQAEALLRDALNKGMKRTQNGAIMQNMYRSYVLLGENMQRQKKWDDAGQCWEAAVVLGERMFGEDNELVTRHRMNLERATRLAKWQGWIRLLTRSLAVAVPAAFAYYMYYNWPPAALAHWYQDQSAPAKEAAPPGL